MSEDITQPGAEGTQQQEAPGVSNPMLSRNASKEGVPPEQPGQPEVKVESPAKPQSQMQQRASTVDALGELASDPQLKPVGEFLIQKLGDADPERAFGNAIKYGDPEMVDLAYLREKLGADAESVAELAKSLFTSVQAKAEAAVNELYTAHGGEASVRQAIQFYNAKAGADERAAMAQLLDSGNKASISYAMKQIMDFATKGGGVRVQAPGVMPVGQPGAQRGLSAAEYQKQVGELHAKRASDAEFDRLLSLRALGKQQGL